MQRSEQRLLALVSVAMLTTLPSFLLAAASNVGLTGGLQVPSPITLKPETYVFGVHAQGFHENNRSTLARESTVDVGMKLNVGVYDNLEVGLEKTIRSGSDMRDDQLTVQLKYRLPVETFNLSVGAVVATGGRDYHSAYVIGGWRAFYGGVGLNFGGSRLQELTTTSVRRFGTAKFGGYKLTRVVRDGSDTFIGEPEEFFAVFGVDFKLSDYFDMIMDFDGDRFAAGFRVNLKDFNFDIAYVGQSETDSLLDRESQHWMFGTGIRF